MQHRSESTLDSSFWIISTEFKEVKELGVSDCEVNLRDTFIAAERMY